MNDKERIELLENEVAELRYNISNLRECIGDADRMFRAPILSWVASLLDSYIFRSNQRLSDADSE